MPIRICKSMIPVPLIRTQARALTNYAKQAVTMDEDAHSNIGVMIIRMVSRQLLNAPASRACTIDRPTHKNHALALYPNRPPLSKVLSNACTK